LLALLATNQNTNSPTCSTASPFYPLFGRYQGQHPTAGTMLAIWDEASYPGNLPPMLSIPNTVFDDAQVGHAVQKDDMDAIDGLQTDLLPPTGQHAVIISCIIPLPPF